MNAQDLKAVNAYLDQVGYRDRRGRRHGQVIGVTLPARHRWRAMLAAHAPGCGSPTPYPGTSGSAPCGVSVEGKLHLCAHCQGTQVAETLLEAEDDAKDWLMRQPARCLVVKPSISGGFIYLNRRKGRKGWFWKWVYLRTMATVFSSVQEAEEARAAQPVSDRKMSVVLPLYASGLELGEAEDAKDWLMQQDYDAPDLRSTRFYIEVQPEDHDPDWDAPDPQNEPEDYAAHQEMLRDIQRRLSRGDYWAYGIVTVYALWQHRFTRDVYKGSDGLGGCSYKGPADFCTPDGYFPQMAQEAYNEMVASYYNDEAYSETAASYHNDGPDPNLKEPVEPGATEIPREVIAQAGLEEPKEPKAPKTDL